MKQTEPTRSELRLGSGYVWGGPLARIIPDSFLESHFVTQTPTFPIGSDEYWMAQALETSLSGIGITNPNPAVGCVLVDQTGKEISRGATQAFPGPHAENQAFAAACQALLLTHPHTGLSPSSEFSQQLHDRLQDATAYVTLEPCCHHGNQPPCVEQILQSPIRKVVIAAQDPDSRVNGGGISRLRAAGKQVTMGVLKNEAIAWNFPFFLKASRTISTRPVVALKWAQTLDGQLADDTDTSKWITSEVARAYTHWLRQRYDCILVGATTLLKDTPSLTARSCLFPHQSDPLVIVWDPKGICLSPSREVQKKLTDACFSGAKPTLLLVSEQAAKESSSGWLSQFENVFIYPLSNPLLPESILTALADPVVEKLLGHPVQSVLIEGGAKTLSLFLRAKIADVLHVFTAPTLTAGHRNRILLEQTLFGAQSFHPMSSAQLGKDTLLEMIASEHTGLFA